MALQEFRVLGMTEPWVQGEAGPLVTVLVQPGVVLMNAVSRSVLLFSCMGVWGLGCGKEAPPVEVDHGPPELIEVYQSATTVPVGGTVRFRLTARDVPDAALRFVWQPEAGALGAPTDQDFSSEVVWTAPACLPSDTSINIQASVTNTWGLLAYRLLTVTVPRGCVGWLATASMNVPRSLHGATVLPSGKVLVVGGVDLHQSDSGIASAELYDPQTGTWTPAGTMGTPRGSPTASVLPTGKVLVVGGGTASAELYDPETGAWTPTGALSAQRFGHTASVLPSGKVLVTGGSTDSAELYDPETGTWSPAGHMSTIRIEHTASVLPSGEVLVVGGRLAVSDTRHPSADLYDPKANSWTPVGNMSTARRQHTASVLPSGQVLVTGGSSADSMGALAERYDPATRIWTSVGSTPVRRWNHTASVLPSGKVLVVGGIGSPGTAEVYDPKNHLWTFGGSMSPSRSEHTATVLPSGRVLIVGGEDGRGALTRADVYDASSLP